jgi:D-beta-D-heptose 7-phosphate kinase/D-beta-D-heptose 1-phosphate adenosyltransferase
MAITSGIFSADANFEDRYIRSADELEELVRNLKGIKLKIVLTSGSYDMLHVGHVLYLEGAKACGDVLIVGVDSDAKIRARKGEDRPLVPENERLLMLACQRPVDLLFLKSPGDEKWGLIKRVRPDVLIVSEDHGYSDEDLEMLREFCGEIKVLERQATITTTERIRQMFMSLGDKLGPQLAQELPGMIERIVRGNRDA